MAIADIIKYEGNNTTFVWKHPAEDFNCLTQLIVHESQEAVFFMNGQAQDVFGPGRYTLETQNIPKIGKLLNRATGDKTPFHCEVYFINKTEQMSIKWGTDSRVQYVEPTYGFPLTIGASGEMTLRVENGLKLLVKLVGTEAFLGQAQLASYFRAFLMTKVKTYLAATIKAHKISIFEIDEQLQPLSDALHEQLMGDFDDYGIRLERFFVMNVVKPDGEPMYEKFKSLHFRQYADIAEAKLQQQVGVINAETEAQRTVIASQAMATKRAQEGYTYQQERGFDVATEVARNEAVGQFTNMGVGLGTMAGVGGAVAGMVGGTMRDAVGSATAPTAGTAAPVTATCEKCGAPLPEGAKFCMECGQRVPDKTGSSLACPDCGAAVPAGAKFCMECGHRFTPVTCPKCGAELTPGAKFCMECGEKL